ncbi:MAG: BMC domain-containing protein [Clostridia bacterium]|nr:BMC domain-containing protein [Clostridia bacterium]
MNKKIFSAIGVVEINFFTNALIALDEMLKASDVHLVSCEKKLGGRMVTIIVGGDTSSVNAAIEAVYATGGRIGEKNIKVAVAISNPHPEIKRLLNLAEDKQDKQDNQDNQAQNISAEPAQSVQAEDSADQAEKSADEAPAAEPPQEAQDNAKQTNQTQKPKTRRTKS